MLRKHEGQINDIIELIENIEGDNLTLIEVGSYMGESMELFAKSGKFKKINASQDGHHTYQCRMLSCSQGWWPG